MKFFGVIDTNVLVSAALKPDSVPRQILELALNGVIVPVLNNEILDEYQDVLSRPKFAFSEQIVKDLVSEIDNAGIHIDAEPIDIELDDPDDLVFYEVVMDAHKNDDAYLVTGDIKHFPEKPFIVTPRQMIELILKSMNLKR